MSFYGFVINKYDEEESIRGDFAYNLQRDKNITQEMKRNDRDLFKYLNYSIVDFKTKALYEDLVNEYKSSKKRF